MIDKKLLEELNGMHVNLNQATLGLNNNFRMVAFSKVGDRWLFKFYLEHDNPADREEVDDIVDQVEAIEWPDFKADVEVIVGKEPIPWPTDDTRVVVRRRE
jgi:hypothetical protein